jgi:hypothetical protein
LKLRSSGLLPATERYPLLPGAASAAAAPGWSGVLWRGGDRGTGAARCRRCSAPDAAPPPPPAAVTVPTTRSPVPSACLALTLLWRRPPRAGGCSRASRWSLPSAQLCASCTPRQRVLLPLHSRCLQLRWLQSASPMIWTAAALLARPQSPPPAASVVPGLRARRLGSARHRCCSRHSAPLASVVPLDRCRGCRQLATHEPPVLPTEKGQASPPTVQTRCPRHCPAGRTPACAAPARGTQ